MNFCNLLSKPADGTLGAEAFARKLGVNHIFHDLMSAALLAKCVASHRIVSCHAFVQQQVSFQAVVSAQGTLSV